MSMNGVVCENITIENTNDRIFVSIVHINNIDEIIKTIVDNIIDLNWINNLPQQQHRGIKAAALPTIEYIKNVCNNIKEAQKTKIKLSLKEKKEREQIRKDFGEYAVSLSALQALQTLYEHNTLPLIEILKEKVKGNHGFDYISISPSILFVFGEAKYRNDGSGASAAAKQIVDFIEKEQPYIDWNFLSGYNIFAQDRCSLDDAYGVSIATNLSKQTIEKHLQRIFKNKHFKALQKRESIYLIFVENEGIF